MKARKKRTPKKKPTRRGPKTDAGKVALVRWYFELEERRHA